jgi:hypothetical protein
LFRKSHALTPDYSDFRRLVPRCALDWMLTPKQRLELAHFQIKKRIWQLGKDRNFGPVIWRCRDSLAMMSLKTAYDSIEVRPMKNAPSPVTVNMSWNTVPEPFKRQFRVAMQPRKPAFTSINQTIMKAALDLGIIARKLQAGDPLHEMDSMAVLAFEHTARLHQLAGNYRLYRIAHGEYSNSAFELFFDSIRKDFSGSYGNIFSARKYDSHRSYYGTAQDWEWFLEAESRGLDINKSADLYALAKIYCEDLRQRAMRGHAPRHTKSHGHTGSAFSSKAIKARRTAVKRHVLNIQKWIRWTYPPLPPDPPKVVS